MKKLTGFLAILFLSFAAAVGQAQADVIYSNFGPGMTFDTNPFHGWTINGFLGPGIGQQAIAQQFTPSVTATFTGAEVALSLFDGPGNISVFLQADSNGLPGPVLEQINVSGLIGVPTIFSAPSVLFPQLERGTPYWLTVVAGEPGVLAGWSWNSIGDVSTAENFAGTQDGNPLGPWELNPFPVARSAFQINGEPIPEITVAVDVKPGSALNSLNPRNYGVIPVAILTTSTFDAATVDVATIRFGKTGTEAAPVQFAFEDIDGDGDGDVILHFETRDTGIVCGDTSSTLAGMTTGGSTFRAVDSINTVGCK